MGGRREKKEGSWEEDGGVVPSPGGLTLPSVHGAKGGGAAREAPLPGLSLQRLLGTPEAGRPSENGSALEREPRVCCHVSPGLWQERKVGGGANGVGCVFLPTRGRR